MIEEKKIDTKTLRHVAGAFPTGVTIVTAIQADGSVHGMTASSFLSVSLDPALVSVCIGKEASLMDSLAEGKTLGISILNARQKHISNQFAGMAEEEKEIPLEKKGEAHLVSGALAWYETTINNIIDAGDHVLVLCQVDSLGRSEEGLPLVYYSGYKTVTEIV